MTTADIDDDMLLELITAELQALGTGCWTQLMGAGLTCIVVPIPGSTDQWLFGDANATWGGSLYTEQGDPTDRYLETGLSCENRDPKTVALAIHAALNTKDQHDGTLDASERRTTHPQDYKE